MSLTSIEIEILETMLLNGASMKATQIAIENKEEVSTTLIHLTKLARMGYINSSQKELYTLMDEGKKALGIQPTTKEIAKNIITYAPHDKSFNFHVDNDKTFHMHAHSLQDFANKLSKVDLKIIECHLDKDDFETWFKLLGDQELTKKVAIIKKRKITGEQLRFLLHNITEQRCQELTKLIEQATP
jgi:hypothetical protein